jgi:acyl carrier protein
MASCEITRMWMSSETIVTEAEIAELIISALRLKIAPQEINPEEPLFVDGLSLDSIDALELALEIEIRYGIRIKADRADVHEIFASLRALTDFISKNRRI